MGHPVECINGCGELAVAETITGIVMDDRLEDGFAEWVELICADCAEAGT